MSERPSQVWIGLLGRLVGPPALAWALTSDGYIVSCMLKVGYGMVPIYQDAILKTSIKCASIWALFYAVKNAEVLLLPIVNGVQALQSTEMPSTDKRRACGTAILCGMTIGAWCAGARTLLDGSRTQGLAQMGLGGMLASIALLAWQ